MDRDTEHLRLLSLFHYIQGALAAGISCFFLLYVFMGLILTGTSGFFHGHNGPPAVLGLILTIGGTLAVVMGWGWAALTIYAGHCLARREHRLFCMIIAGLGCLWIPYGTILGILTLVVLQRPTVEALFERPKFAA